MNAFLRFYQIAYLPLCVSTMINLYKLNFDKNKEIISSLITFYSFFLGLLYGPFIIIFLKINNKLLQYGKDSAFYKTWGTLFYELKTDCSWSLFYNGLFIMRRLLFSIASILLYDYGVC